MAATTAAAPLGRPPSLLLARRLPARPAVRLAARAPSPTAKGSVDLACDPDQAFYFVPPASAVRAAEQEAAAAAAAAAAGGIGGGNGIGNRSSSSALFYGGSPPGSPSSSSSSSSSSANLHQQHRQRHPSNNNNPPNDPNNSFWQAVGGLAARAAEAAAPQVVLLPDALPPEAAAAVARECRALRPKLAPELNCIAAGRLGCYLASRSATHKALSSAELAAKLTRRLRSRLPLAAASYPMELRHYPRGSSMPWHSDEALYSDPQWELIYTVDNDSDSETEWRDAAGRLHGAWTPPGSLLCVRAEGWQHRVTSVRRGSRLIVKLCYTVEGAAVLPSFAQNLGRVAYDHRG
jgi:hypothetical protein